MLCLRRLGLAGQLRLPCAIAHFSGPSSLVPPPRPSTLARPSAHESAMTRQNPVTPAIRALRAAGIAFAEHPYNYEEKGGTRVSARELGVDEHAVIKTLVLEDENKLPLVVLMHGDQQVSTKNLARTLGKKQIHPCTPDIAAKHTGYLVGGTSPLGTRKPLPVYAEATIFDLPVIYLNGGARGFLVALDPMQLQKLLTLELVEVGIPG